MLKIAEAMQNGQFTYEQFRHYQEWLHAEKVFDPKVKEEVEATRDEGWHNRYAGAEHNFMSTTAEFLAEDGKRTSPDVVTVCATCEPG